MAEDIVVTAPYDGAEVGRKTREGPAYAVREMTEDRLVVLQA
jgi:hypothetical protein